jgi:RNA polymerase-binding protein DksA
MDKKTLSSLKTQLEEKRQAVIKQLDSIGHKVSDNGETNFTADFPQYGDSAEDNAIEVADYAKNLSVEKELEKELRDIDKALKSMASGKYGVCIHCGKDIEVERLKIRPESGSCVSCKQAISGRK